MVVHLLSFSIRMFCAKHSISRVKCNMKYACALFNKITPLISMYFLRMQMKNDSSKNTLNYF